MYVDMNVCTVSKKIVCVCILLHLLPTWLPILPPPSICALSPAVVVVLVVVAVVVVAVVVVVLVVGRSDCISSISISSRSIYACMYEHILF